MSILEMLPCPNPSCRGTGDSLEIREDPRCTRTVLAPDHGFNSERSKQRENGGRP